MRTILSLLFAIATFNLAACTNNQSSTNNMNKKAIVIYFSATGTTKDVAKRLAGIADADLQEITPEQPYTAEDLDWNDKQSRSSVEMGNPKSRPAIRPLEADVSQYDIIFIGYPIWWDLAPTAVNTFIENHRLEGKTLVPFATSGGSTIQNSVTQLKAAYPNIVWKEGKLLNHPSDSSLSQWVESLGL